MSETITYRQAIFLISMYYLGSAMLTLTGVLAYDTRQDAWLAVLFTLAVHLLTIPLYIAIGKQIQAKSFGEHLTGLLGSIGGKLFAAAFVVLYPFLYFTLSMYDTAQFISTLVLPRTPSTATIFMFTIVVVAGCYCGIKTIGRTSELLFPIIIAFVAIIAISLAPQIEWKHLLPVMDRGIRPVAKASLPFIGFPYWETSMLLFVLPYLMNRKKFGAVLLHGAWISGAIFLISTTITLMVLGPKLSASLIYPSYYVTRTINIGDFYERIEEIFTLFWYIIIFYRLSILFFVTVEGLSYAFSIPSKKRLLIPIALIGVTLSKYAAPSVSAQLEMAHDLPFGYGGLFGVLLPAVLLVTGKIKNRPT